MPNRSVNHEAVVMMAKTGFHVTCIAERLECSRRQVDRILKSKPISPDAFLFDFQDEHLLWKFYKNCGETDAKIALRFGVTRQAVHSHFKRMKNLSVVALEPVHRGFPFTTQSIELVPDAEFELVEG